MFYSSDTTASLKTRAESDGVFGVGCVKHYNVTKGGFSEVCKLLYIMTLISFVKHLLMTWLQMVYSKDVTAHLVSPRGPLKQCIVTM